MTRVQAEEQASAWLLKQGICYKHSNGQWVAEKDEVISLADMLLATEAVCLEEAAQVVSGYKPPEGYKMEMTDGTDVVRPWLEQIKARLREQAAQRRMG